MKNKNNWVKPPFLSEIYSHVSQQSKDTGDVFNDDPGEAGFAQGARGFNPVAPVAWTGVDAVSSPKPWADCFPLENIRSWTHDGNKLGVLT